MVKETIQVSMCALMFEFGQRSLEKVPFYILGRGLRAVLFPCSWMIGLQLMLPSMWDLQNLRRR